MEDDGTRMLFVAERRNLNRIAVDAGLLADVAWRLRDEGRARLPGRLGVLAREIEEKARIIVGNLDLHVSYLNRCS